MSTLSGVLLFVFCLSGGIVGLWKYGVKREPLPSFRNISLSRLVFGGLFARQMAESYHRRLVSVLMFLLSALSAAVVFIYIITVAGASGKSVLIGSPFEIERSGNYTVFIPKSQNLGTNRMLVMAGDRKELIRTENVFGVQELRFDGSKYKAVCHVEILSPGTYSIVSAPAPLNCSLIIRSRVGLTFVLVTVLLFIACISFFALGIQHLLAGVKGSVLEK